MQLLGLCPWAYINWHDVHTEDKETIIHIKMYMLKPSILALATTALAQTSCLPAWSAHTCHLFSESMAYLDRIYDPAAGYVYDPSAATAMRHDTRTSAWYAVGLLARNQADDVDHAATIITNVIAAQFKDPNDQWCVPPLYHQLLH